MPPPTRRRFPERPAVPCHPSAGLKNPGPPRILLSLARCKPQPRWPVQRRESNPIGDTSISSRLLTSSVRSQGCSTRRFRRHSARRRSRSRPSTRHPLTTQLPNGLSKCLRSSTFGNLSPEDRYPWCQSSTTWQRRSGWGTAACRFRDRGPARCGKEQDKCHSQRTDYRDSHPHSELPSPHFLYNVSITNVQPHPVLRTRPPV